MLKLNRLHSLQRLFSHAITWSDPVRPGLCSYTHDIEALSCDEVLIDATALLSELGVAPDDLARAIRGDIQERTGCSASVGIGESDIPARVFLAKYF